jgi:uncharacterized protein YlxP (DUF503 family)
VTVVTLRMGLRVLRCSSPREKRRQVQDILVRLHRGFNVSVAADDGDGGPDHTVLFAAAVARTRRDAREILERLADAVAAHPRTEVLAHEFQEV